MFLHSWWFAAIAMAVTFSLLRRAAWRRGGRWHRHGFGHQGRLWRVMRELNLDRAQRREIRKELFALRGSAWQMSGARFEAFDTIVDAVSQDEFDRGGVDAFVDTQLAHLDALRTQFMHTLERVHEILRPDQRDKLREIFGTQPFTPAPSTPYR